MTSFTMTLHLSESLCPAPFVAVRWLDTDINLKSSIIPPSGIIKVSFITMPTDISARTARKLHLKGILSPLMGLIPLSFLSKMQWSSSGILITTLRWFPMNSIYQQLSYANTLILMSPYLNGSFRNVWVLMKSITTIFPDAIQVTFASSLIMLTAIYMMYSIRETNNTYHCIFQVFPGRKDAA